MRFISGAGIVAAVGVHGVVACAALGASLTGRLQVEPKPIVTKININPIGDPEPGGGQLPEAILRILSADLDIHDPVPMGLSVTRGTLGPDRAYGFGLPNGYTTPPPNNPSGPWVGLMWPYRDFNDGYAPRTPPPPLGNDVGEFVVAGAASGVYLVRNMIGEMAYNIDIPSTYERGVFTDSDDDARFFKIELESLVDVSRPVTVTMRNFRALMLVRDEASGRLYTEEFTAPDTTIVVYIPVPGTAGVLAMGGLLAARRRRRA